MGTREIINTASITNAASLVSASKTYFENDVSTLTRTVDSSISSNWNSNAAQEALGFFHALSVVFDNHGKILNQYEQFLNNVIASGYEAVETYNVSVGSSLEDSFL